MGVFHFLFTMLHFQYSSSGNNSAAKKDDSKGGEMDTESENNLAPQSRIVFEKFQCLYHWDISGDELSIGFKKMHNNEKLIKILDIVQDYETSDEVLYKKTV